MHGNGLLSRRSIGFLCGIVAASVALPLSADSITVEERGSLILPTEIQDAQGRAVPVVGLSGIAWVGDDRYVAIMDNSSTVVGFRLELGGRGRPLAASGFTVSTLGERHDYEDVVWLPSPPGADGEPRAGEAAGRVLVCEEDSPAIHAFDLGSGRRLATLAVPEIFRTRRANRGFESLAIDAGGRHVWTANEEPLPGDGPAVAAGSGGVVRLVRVPLARPDPAVGPTSLQHAYPVDPPHEFVRVFEGEPLSGVSAIVAVGPDRLLVLERSGGPGLPPFESRLYEVSLAGAEDVSGVREGLGEKVSARLLKRLVWKGRLGINVEGLCIGPSVGHRGTGPSVGHRGTGPSVGHRGTGPSVGDGERSMIGIGDNGGLDTPSQLVVFAIGGTTGSTSP